VPESAANLALMRRIDEQYLRAPYYGSRRMAVWLRRQGEVVNRKRVQRLMRLMSLEAIYPKRRTSVPGAGHKIYPYLLRNVAVISMDGRGRALDNVFVERLWRTVKYEDVYLKDYATGAECHAGLGAYLRFYCVERPHQALAYRTPAEVYWGEASGKRRRMRERVAAVT
jgi:putative transposase